MSATLTPDFAPAVAAGVANCDSLNSQTLAIDRFACCVRLHPHYTALSHDGEHLTYAELDLAACHVAVALQRRGVRAGSIVGLYLDRSFALAAAMLGVWKAGCAYLPLDTNSPLSRTDQILQDCGPAILLTDGLHAIELGAFTTPVMTLDRLEFSASSHSGIYPLTAESLACVMYTSGSTGTPKGVMVTHGNLAAVVAGAETMFGLHAADVWAMCHSPALRFSTWEVWGALCFGGRLIVLPRDTCRSPEDLLRTLVRERVSILTQTPTAFCMLAGAESSAPQQSFPKSLRLVVLGGEGLELASLRAFYQHHGDSAPQLVNMYGVTEATVHAAARFLTPSDVSSTESLIGLPVPGTRIHLLDEKLVPVAAHAVGEICIAGTSVSPGYLSEPERTAKRFVTLSSGERVYRTGDLGRVNGSGELVYVGRSDNQVRLDGVRVEPSEVEAVLANCPVVSQVCVVPVHHPQAGTRLAAYFVGSRSGSVQRTLCAFADRHLAAYMRPSFWVQMPRLPLDKAGKVDRKALPEPGQNARKASHDSMTPLEAKIAAVWSETLEYSDVGPDTNFFDVGGNSMLLFAVRARLQQVLAQEIPVTWMFESSTVRSFARKLSAEHGG